MSQPTAGERALAVRLRVDAAAVAAAREALNRIASLPWPRPERVSLLARLARAAGADVGKVLSGLALDAAPLVGLEALVPVPGLGYKRVAGLTRALSNFDITTLTSDDVGLRDAKAAIAALRAENDILRKELDRLRVGPPAEGGDGRPPSGPAIMRIADVASSMASQIALVDQLLRSRPNGLRLGGVDLQLRGTGTCFDGDVALDLGSPTGGSAVGISFVPGRSEVGRRPEAQVPDVSGYTTALAERKLLARGFGVVFTRVAGARGIVTEQSPPPRTVAPTGSVVRLVVREPSPLIFEPSPGSFTNSVTVTIMNLIPEATIRYTTDGTDPTATTGTLYSGPVTLSATTRLKARAFKAGMSDGAMMAVDYTRAAAAAAPTFNPGPGSFTSSVTVAITTATPKATIRYTADGTDPTATTGTLCSGPVTLSATTTLKARAFSAGLSDSAATSSDYTWTALMAAEFVGQAVPSSMISGSTYKVSITMRNAGNTTWTPGGTTPVRLGSQSPEDTPTWGAKRCDLPTPAAPGAAVTFAFTVVAPPPGTHVFQWRMVQGMSAWFGASAQSVLVTVSAATYSVYGKNLAAGIGGNQL